MPDFELENAVRQRAHNPNLLVAGLDEAGVGALAGPIVAAAVVLGKERDWFAELRDSKKLSPRQRYRLRGLIVDNAAALGIEEASNDEIDEVGVTHARRYAVLRAFWACEKSLGGASLAVVCDDSRLDCLSAELGGEPSIFRDKADEESYSVAAASIVAKVERDEFMRFKSLEYQQYKFADNKGYGTRAHLEALERFGPCPLHRRSFAPVKNAGKERG
ncbi:hypothetical protein LCGC14_2661480 [marine sediment metagenome]|uniref:Ribonuclease HII n=1 Tax=marine sediment metagenome TaxID=412755 RepID=A0A0F9CIR3_9ZZZZ